MQVKHFFALFNHYLFDIIMLGEDLTYMNKTCLKCGALNWPNAEQCATCNSILIGQERRFIQQPIENQKQAAGVGPYIAGFLILGVLLFAGYKAMFSLATGGKPPVNMQREAEQDAMMKEWSKAAEEDRKKIEKIQKERDERFDAGKSFDPNGGYDFPQTKQCVTVRDPNFPAQLKTECK